MIKMTNPAWEAALKSLLATVAYKLGVDPDHLSAKQQMMMIMEKVRLHCII